MNLELPRQILHELDALITQGYRVAENMQNGGATSQQAEAFARWRVAYQKECGK